MEEILQLFVQNREKTLQVLDEVSDINLDYRINPAVRSIAELFAHIGAAVHSWMNETLRDGQSIHPRAGGPWDKHSLRELLRESGERLGHFFAPNPQALKEVYRAPWGAEYSGLDRVLYLMAHEAHHRGQIVMALRAAGSPARTRLPW